MITKTTCVKFLLLIFIFLNTNIGFAQLRPAIAWQKCIGGTGNDEAKDVLITNDGKLVVAGLSYSNDGDITDHHGSNTTSDALIVQMDTAGNIIWKKSIGGTANDLFSTVIAAEGGGYICTGTSFSNDGDVSGNHGNGDLWVVKINTDGSIAWSRCYGGSLYDYGADATQTGDGNYAFMGTSFSYDGDVLSGINGRIDSDAWAFKTDAAGNIIWEKCLDFVFNFYHPRKREDIGYNITRSETGNLYAYTTGTIDFDSHYTQPFADTPRAARAELYELNNSNGIVTLIGPAPDNYSSGSDSLCSMYKAPGKIYASYIHASFNAHEHCWYTFYGAGYVKPDGVANFSGTPFNLGYWSGLYCGAPEYYGQSFVAPTHGLTEEPSLSTIMGVGIKKMMDWCCTDAFPGAFVSIGTSQYSYGNLDGSVSTSFNSVKVFPSGSEYIVVGYEQGDGADVSGHHASAGTTSDCWVVKLQSLNKIVGNVFVDANNNNIMDAGELPFTDAIAKTTKQGFELSAIPYNGIYRNVVDTGTFTTVLNINRPYYTATPASKVSVFTNYKNTDSANFAVHPIPGIKDYSIGMVALTQPRPGFNLQYKISYFNKGTTTLTNKLVTFVKDSRTQFLGAVPANTSIIGDTIKWNISTLAPWTGGSIIVNLQLATIPTVNIGDIITNTALIDSIGDYHVADNFVALNETVSGSYDPNDKKESFAGEIYPPDIAAGKYLNYNIRFQNTGNDTAFNIILRDTLDIKLNADSIEVISASHPYSINIKDKKYLTILFNNIKLADSVHNEPLSHGYFSYRIKPASTLALGDTIKNRAAIYFDFNLPIKTNTEITVYKPTPLTNLWTGAVSTAWEDPLNWGNHLVPDENTNVIINTGLPRYPVINSNAVCRTITVKTGTSVLVKTGFALKVTH